MDDVDIVLLRDEVKRLRMETDNVHKILATMTEVLGPMVMEYKREKQLEQQGHGVMFQ